MYLICVASFTDLLSSCINCIMFSYNYLVIPGGVLITTLRNHCIKWSCLNPSTVHSVSKLPQPNQCALCWKLKQKLTLVGWQQAHHQCWSLHSPIISNKFVLVYHPVCSRKWPHFFLPPSSLSCIRLSISSIYPSIPPSCLHSAQHCG